MSVFFHADIDGDNNKLGFESEDMMKDWQKLIGAVIIAAAIMGASLILADAIRYSGNAINAGLFGIAHII